MKYYKAILSLLILIFMNLTSHADELSGLFTKLKNSENHIIAKQLENKIWNYWTTSSSNEENNLKMQYGIQLMNNGNIKNALNIFLQLCNLEPQWPEPFNKVATIKFIQKDYKSSIHFIKLTLKKEPRHFGAISGLAQININLGKFDDALKNINYVSKIHPFIEIKKLKPFLLEKLKKKEINFIFNYIY